MNSIANDTAAPLEDRFWQTLPSEPTLTDEQSDCDSLEEMTRVSAEKFRFCQEDEQAMISSLTEVDEAGPGLVEMGKEGDYAIKEQYEKYFTDGTDQKEVEASSFNHEEASPNEGPEDEQDCNGIVVLKDFDTDEEASYKSTDTTSSDSTVPTISPPGSPEKLSKASDECNKQSFNTYLRYSKKSSFDSRKSTAEKTKASINSSGRTTASSSALTSAQTSTISFVPSKASQIVSPRRKPPRRKMSYYSSSCCRSNDMESIGDETFTVVGSLAKTCESFMSPLFFGLWEENDQKSRPDDETLATYETDISYEEEQGVSVLVAVQATVLGSDYPETLEPPKENNPHVWGNNFVGLVQKPKGCTVHSRMFPPGSRVGSVSAWSTASHKPYISCNTSHLLPIPPIGGIHLDAPEVAVVIAAYLPAFQALHHGQRRKRVSAYTPIALEGQRVLILAHANKPNSTNQSLVDAQVQAAVRLALLAGARDVHVTLTKIGDVKKRLFGNDYRVRLLDTPSQEWVPTLKSRIDVILDYTNGVDMEAATTVLNRKGRYVGCIGSDCGSSAIHCREEGPSSTRKSSWTDGFAIFHGGNHECSSPLPEGKDLRQIVEWTALCISMKNASLFDFYYNWKHDRRLAEHDFNFLLGLLAKRHIRPNVAMILDVDHFPSANASANQKQHKSRPMKGAIVCEPWVSQSTDLDDISACSSLSH